MIEIGSLNIMKDSVAVITGGGSGIGEAVCRILSSRGMHACVCDNDEKAANEVAESIKNIGEKASAWKMDVSDPGNVKDIFDKIASELGLVYVLVSSAGVPGHGLLDKITDEYWANVIDVNLNGVMYCMRQALRHMLDLEKGVIINISSICGIMGCSNSPSYSASKAAVIGLSKSCARHHTKDGIRINVVAPGLVETPFVELNRKLGKLKNDIAKVPLGRMGTAKEIAELVAFLCSDAAEFISGQVISPNGGQLI
jgi:NAD(P)-dependent dehydrogenase (short-subunit alcohol dehydrogenase family)